MDLYRSSETRQLGDVENFIIGPRQNMIKNIILKNIQIGTLVKWQDFALRQYEHKKEKLILRRVE